MFDFDAARYRWHPIAASDDLPYRHVFHAQILGRELALWRADDDHVNAWENRCLHRGVRLSIGINDGTELVCQYHGWRYANRTAGCTYIPAHPADAPARTICNNTYPSREFLGLVWTCESPDEPLPSFDTLNTDKITVLRAIAVDCALTPLAESLSRHITEALPDYHCIIQDDFTLVAKGQQNCATDIIFFLQPQSANCTIIRGVLCGLDQCSTHDTLVLQQLSFFSQWLNLLRDNVERATAHQEPLDAWIPNIPQVGETIATMPELHPSSRHAALRVRLARTEVLANDIRTFVLESIDTALPAPQPGAHIDVHLPNGMIRQYSLINGPGQTDHYAIAVKHLSDSTGGSDLLHRSVKAGDVLACSIPRNNFSLRRDAQKTILIAGGIGITPLLSMARALHHSRLPFELHYFVASAQDIIFQQELESMSGDVHFHVDQTVKQTEQALNELLRTAHEKTHLYVCGPAPMIRTTQDIAARQHWPDENVHFEYFKNTQTRDSSSSFVVELAKSGLTLNVPAGESLLSVLRENQIAVASSCEQGACGTCKVDVIDGIPDHQDVYLSDTERHESRCMMSCVSRAKSDRLILDL